jgi:hypothetical protein
MPARLVWVLDGEPIDLVASVAKLQALLDAVAGGADLTVTCHLSTEFFGATEGQSDAGDGGELLPDWRPRLAPLWRGKEWVVTRRDREA